MKIVVATICCFLLIAIAHCTAQEKAEQGLQEIKNANNSNALIRSRTHITAQEETEQGLQEIKNSSKSNALLIRPKRFWALIFAAVKIVVAVQSWVVANWAVIHGTAAAIGTVLGIAAATKSLASRRKRDTDICLSARASKIGFDDNLARKFFELPEVQHGELKNIFHYEEHGAYCNENFCKKYGDGMFGFGICSRQYCHCAHNTPTEHMCGEGTVYDPFNKVCNHCQNLKFCAFWSSPNQLWVMKHDGTIARLNTNKCVDNKDWSTENGTPIQQWDCGSISTVQQWKYEPAAGYTDRWFIMNIHSRKCMQIKGISYENGAQIEQWECNFNQPHPNQLWKYVDGHFQNVNSGKCLDAPENSLENGKILQQWDCY